MCRFRLMLCGRECFLTKKAGADLEDDVPSVTKLVRYVGKFSSLNFGIVYIQHHDVFIHAMGRQTSKKYLFKGVVQVMSCI